MAGFPFDALIAVFGPVVALSVTYDVYKRVTHRPKGFWIKLGVNAVIIIGSNMWSEYVLFVNSLGVSQDGLEAIRQAVQSVDSQLPLVVQVIVPEQVLLILVLSLVLLSLLY